MARDPEIWGEDAAELKPSRWIDEDGKTLRKFSQWQAHAFNGGTLAPLITSIRTQWYRQVRVYASARSGSAWRSVGTESSADS
jgi:hypothetical protein